MSLKILFRLTLNTLIPCLFFGVTLISIAGGAVFPPINLIAKPFVCSNGDMNFQQTVYRPSPGTTVTMTDWVCVDARSGEKRVIGLMELVLPSGIIYGLVAFVPIMAIVVIGRFRRAKYSPVEEKALTQQEALEKLKLINLGYQASHSDGSSVESPGVIPNNIGFTSDAGSGLHSVAIVKDAAEELGKLKQLLDSGLITQQDYDQKKKEILTRL